MQFSFLQYLPTHLSAFVALLVLTGCNTPGEPASHNLTCSQSSVPSAEQSVIVNGVPLHDDVAARQERLTNPRFEDWNCDPFYRSLRRP
jgi:hypothetical protein